MAACWVKKQLFNNRYVYHNDTTNIVYNIFLVPEEVTVPRNPNDVYIRTSGGHVLLKTKLFSLQPDECMVFYGQISLAEKCQKEKGLHECVVRKSNDWFRAEKAKRHEYTEYIELGGKDKNNTMLLAI